MRNRDLRRMNEGTKMLADVSFKNAEDKKLADELCDDIVDTSLYKFNFRNGKFKGISRDRGESWYRKEFTGKKLTDIINPDEIDYSTDAAAAKLAKVIIGMIKPALAKKYKDRFSRVRRQGTYVALDLYFVDKTNGEEVALEVPLSDLNKPISALVSVTESLVYVLFYK